MGSLAGLLRSLGLEVRGSDENVYPPISTMLETLRIPVMGGYRPANLDPAPDLVVVGNIVGRANPEAAAVIERGLRYMSMPEAIGEFVLEGRHPVVISGTHGKTTTSALMSHVLRSAGRDPSWIVGGVMIGSDRSFNLGEGDHVVVEGDEYETSFFDKGPKFLHYRPRTAILTSIEYDHAEMYPDMASIERAFARFVDLIPPDGTLVACADAATVAIAASRARCRVISYGYDRGDLLCRIVSEGPQGAVFTIGDGTQFHIPQTGRHNVMNAVAVIAVARSLGLADAEIAEGLSSFLGVKRRQEIRGEPRGITIIDDFAHHPTAVRETIAGIRARYPGARLWAVFEPRTNTTRRKVFQEAYAASFGGADVVLIADVDHPERAPEGNRLDVHRLIEELMAKGMDARHAPGADDIVAVLAAEAMPGDVVLVMSNGAFGGIHGKLLAELSGREIAGQ
jgi:UDP-N-acetylmuramate: L-alanyl-gamma-D-glutamyl-meso-diaminopimelate ligase